MLRPSHLLRSVRLFSTSPPSFKPSPRHVPRERAPSEEDKAAFKASVETSLKVVAARKRAALEVAETRRERETVRDRGAAAVSLATEREARGPSRRRSPDRNLRRWNAASASEEETFRPATRTRTATAPPPPPPASRTDLPRNPPPWLTQRRRLQALFPSGWAPPRRLSREAQTLLRLLHKSSPETYTTPVLAERFRISPEGVRRVLKAKEGAWSMAEGERERREQRRKERRVEERRERGEPAWAGDVNGERKEMERLRTKNSG